MKIKSKLRNYIVWLLLTLVIIFFVSRVTSHSDLFNVAINSLRIIGGDFKMIGNSNGTIIYDSFFPPMFHFVDGLISYPFIKLGVYNFGILKYVSDQRLLDISFLLKLRYLVLFLFSLLVMKSLSEYFEESDKKWKIMFLWLLCPVLIFVPFSWGNNDIYPMFFSLLFLLFAFKRKNIWAMIFLGLSMAMKNYAVFLIIPAAIVLANKNFLKTITYTFTSITVYLIPYVLFYKVAHTFVTGGGEGLFILQRNIFNGPLLFPLVYFLINLFLIFKQEINKDNKNEVLVKYCFAILSLFYLTSLYIPHWFLWIIPFFALTAYKDRRLFYLYVIICFVFFVGLFSWGRNLDTNLFSVAFPIINKLPTIEEITARYFSDFKIFSIFYSLFFASFIAYLYILFFDKKNDNLTEKEIKIFSLIPLFVYLMICLVFVLGMIFIRNKKNRDWYDLGLVSRNEFIGPVVEPKMFYQTFQSPKDRLKGVNIYFSTYGKKINSAYELVLYGSDCKTEIRRAEVDVVKIEDNKYKEVVFDEITDSTGKNYCFTVAPKSDEVNTPVTLNYSQKDSYLNGELILNGKKTKDDIVFQLIYPVK